MYAIRSYYDLNRAGTPLLEIVSEPDLRGAREAVAYARALHALVVWIGVCDGNMQEGSFRCDANVSVRRAGAGAYGTRVITSYSIHYTKLYDSTRAARAAATRNARRAIRRSRVPRRRQSRITSYNVCYTKLLRLRRHQDFAAHVAALLDARELVLVV